MREVEADDCVRRVVGIVKQSCADDFIFDYVRVIQVRDLLSSHVSLNCIASGTLQVSLYILVIWVSINDNYPSLCLQFCHQLGSYQKTDLLLMVWYSVMLCLRSLRHILRQ